MTKYFNTSTNLVRLNKDSENTQREIFLEFFKSNTTTVYAFEKATGISRANGCRFKAYYEAIGLIKVVKIGRCPISDENGVQFLSADKSKFPAVQLPIPFNQPNQ